MLFLFYSAKALYVFVHHFHGYKLTDSPQIALSCDVANKCLKRLNLSLFTFLLIDESMHLECIYISYTIGLQRGENSRR